MLCGCANGAKSSATINRTNQNLSLGWNSGLDANAAQILSHINTNGLACNSVEAVNQTDVDSISAKALTATVA